jgi:pyrroline-5-carboxylate reductase
MPRTRSLLRVWRAGAPPSLLQRRAPWPCAREHVQRRLPGPRPRIAAAGYSTAPGAPLAEMRLAFVGAGKMAEAIVGGLPPALWPAVIVSDHQPARCALFRQRFGVAIAENNAAACTGADVVVLAVKPNNVEQAMASIRGRIAPDGLVLSIVAGCTTAQLAGLGGHAAVVRTMPNTPAMIGRGMTVWCATAEVSEAQRAVVRGVLNAIGEEHFVTDEIQLDMATAVPAPE